MHGLCGDRFHFVGLPPRKGGRRKVLRHHLKEQAGARQPVAEVERVAVMQDVACCRGGGAEQLAIHGDLRAAQPGLRHEMKNIVVVIYVCEHARRQRAAFFGHQL